MSTILERPAGLAVFHGVRDASTLELAAAVPTAANNSIGQQQGVTFGPLAR